MNGNIEYNITVNNKIKAVLSRYPELKGFNSFMGDKAISTRYSYLEYIAKFLDTVNKSASSLNVDDFSGYLLDIQTKPDGSETSSSYRIAVYAALKQYGNYLVASRKIDLNPMNYIKRPKSVEALSTTLKREQGYLTKREIKQMTSSIEKGSGTQRNITRFKERDLAIISIFLNTGMRCSALMKLDVKDINFEQQTISVTDKGNKVAVFDVSDITIERIQQWMNKRKLMLGDQQLDALFITDRKSRMKQGAIYAMIQKYTDNIKNKHITPHKLRATYGTQLYDATKDIYFVQQRMHHNSPKTTELYIRGTKSDQGKKASDIMSKLL